MNAPLVQLLFLAHVVSTWFMLGVIWLVQVVHYPLFANVGNAEFASFEKRHTRLITFIVAPPMLVEAATAVLLLVFPPPSISPWSQCVGAALLIVVWLSTAFLQVPCHTALARAFDPKVHHRLVTTNWLRTVAWSLRGALLLWMTWSFISQIGTVTANRGSMEMATVKVGDRVPDFTAKTHDGNTIRTADFLGKRALVLFFYPKDGTTICTQEACAFRDSYERFSEAGGCIRPKTWVSCGLEVLTCAISPTTWSLLRCAVA